MFLDKYFASFINYFPGNNSSNFFSCLFSYWVRLSGAYEICVCFL